MSAGESNVPNGSGGSANVIKAVQAAGALGITSIALTGNSGGELAAVADRCLNVEETITARIQEVHITICHILCELVDHILFERAGRSSE